MRGTYAGALLDALGYLLREGRRSLGRRLDEHCQRLVILSLGDIPDGNCAPGADPRQVFQCGLEVVWCVVGASHNDDLLVPTAEEELILVFEAEIACVQPPAVYCLI